MKIAVCVPAYGDVKARFVLSLIALITRSIKARVIVGGETDQLDISTHMAVRCPRIEIARETLAQAALDAGSDYILWLDADQTFPDDALLRLIKHNLPFVGCNIRKRNPDAVEPT